MQGASWTPCLLVLLLGAGFLLLLRDPWQQAQVLQVISYSRVLLVGKDILISRKREGHKPAERTKMALTQGIFASNLWNCNIVLLSSQSNRTRSNPNWPKPWYQDVLWSSAETGLFTESLVEERRRRILDYCKNSSRYIKVLQGGCMSGSYKSPLEGTVIELSPLKWIINYLPPCWPCPELRHSPYHQGIRQTNEKLSDPSVQLKNMCVTRTDNKKSIFKTCMHILQVS